MSQTLGVARVAVPLLIVDDEVEVAAELADAATAEGFDVRVANSAADALALLQAHPEIGVMVSDIRMPGWSGLELTRRATAQRTEATALEVIFITGHATVEDAITAVQIGAFDFVRKPFRLDAIFETIRRAMARSLGRRRIGAALDAPAAAPAGGAGTDWRLDPALLQSLMHDLRTPLVPILGFAELLDSDTTGPERREFAQHIRSGALLLLETMDNLVALGRMQNGDLAPCPRPAALAPLLSEIAGTLRPVAALLGSEIAAHASPDLAASLDVDLLRRALGVLARVALHRAGRDGEVTLVAKRVAAGISVEVRAAHPLLQDRGVEAVAGADILAQVTPLGLRLVDAVATLLRAQVALQGPPEAAFGARLVLADA